jgi:RNA recognition motif-containing protein
LRKKLCKKRKLYVGNLNYAVTEAQLEEYLRLIMVMSRSLKLLKDEDLDSFEMATPEEAEQAKEA